MYTLSDNQVLPEIFATTKDFFAKTAERVDAFKNKVVESENPTGIVGGVFEKYNKYQINGFNVLKTAMGDLCVGVKALGNKFAVLGGESFENLKTAGEQIVAKTGEFLNFIAGFIVSAEEVLTPSDKNVERFVVLANTASEYLTTVATNLETLSTATKFLYGDTKDRLGERFESMSASIVNFIHMAKIKIVSAIANAMVGVKVLVETFAGVVETNQEALFVEFTLIDENGAINKESAKALLAVIIKDFAEALSQANALFA